MLLFVILDPRHALPFRDRHAPSTPPLVSYTYLFETYTLFVLCVLSGVLLYFCLECNCSTFCVDVLLLFA